MANDKKFIVKNGLLTPQNVVIGSNSDTGENLQVTGTSKLSGNVQITQSTAETPSIDVHNSGGYLSEAIVARFRGDSDSLQIINIGIGDYKLVNSQQNNGIIFYDNTPGVRILYNNAARLDINSAGNRFYGLSTTTIDNNRILTVADEGSGNGLDADTVDGLEANQFVRSDVDDIMAGNYTIQQDLVVSGNLTVSGTTTTINTEEILLADNIITLNSNYTGSAPTEEAGIEIERGTLDNPKILWDETSDYWKLVSGNLTDLGRIITTADEGSGNGFDADTVDGLEGFQFLRSDVDDTANGNITILGDLTLGDNVGGAQINFDGVGNNRTLYSESGVIGFLNQAFNYAARSTSDGDWIVERDVQADRNLIAQTNITANAGDITATAGDVIAGDSITAQNNITATAGNIAASAGSVAAATTVTAGTDVIGQRFVDADNNSYLVDPAGTSTMNDIGIDDDLFHNGDTNTKLSFGTDDISLQTGGAERLGIDNDSVDSTVTFTAPSVGINTDLFHNGDTDTKIAFTTDELKIDTDGVTRLTANTNGVFVDNLTASGNISAAIEVEAPIYYDKDDRTYYGDFASTSRINDIALVGQIIHDGDTNTFLDFNAADSFQIVAGGIGIFTATSTTVTVDGDLTVTGTITGGDANFTGDVSANNITATTAMYSPIYYDADNNGYYGDFAGTSVFNRISIDDYVVHNGDTNTYIGFSAADTFDVVTGGTTRLTVDTTYVTSTLDGIFPNLFALRYYDAENATFYTEPAATSRMNDISLVGEIIHDGDTDTYLQFHNANQFRVVTGGAERLEVNNSFVLANNQMRSPIFYDSNNTAYYGDFASTSQMNRIDIDDYIRHRGDLDTYMGFDAADTWGVWTNGVRRLTSNATAFTSGLEVRAPRFVDSNDINYYVDPANASLSATLNGAVRIGSIANNSRWSDNSGNGGISLLSYGDDTATSNPSIAVSGNYTGTYALLYLNRIDPNPNPFNGGNRYIEFSHDGTAGGTIRGDGSGNLYQILAAGTNWGFWTSAASEALIVDDNGDVMIAAGASPTYTDGGDNTPLVGTNNPAKLHVGGSIYLNNNDDAIIFGRGTGSFLKNQELAFGWGSGWYMTDASYLRVRNNTAVYSTGDYYGSRFYATGATAYYLDPNGDSQLNTIDIDDYIRHRGDTNTYIGFAANDTFRVWTGGVQRLNIDNNSADFAVNVYAPSFIDSDDNTFFIDGNSTSVLRYLNVYSGDSVGEMNVGRSSTQRIRQYITDGIGYIQYWQDETDSTDHSLRFEILSSSSGTNTFQFNRPISMTGTGAAGYIFAPRYYDADNNTYYGDFASTSIMNRIDLEGSIRHRGDTNTYIQFHAADQFRVVTGGTERLEVNNTATTGIRIDATADMRAPIYYDRNNTGYYGDFASNSRLNTIQALRYYFNHNTTYYMDQASGTYGSVKTGGATGGWSGYAIEDWWVFMANGVNNAGIFNDTDNEWAIQVARNSDVQIYFNGTWEERSRSGYMEARGSYRAPIFYDINNTAYYGNFAGGNTSTALRIGGVYDRLGFQTSGDGNNNILLRAQDYSHWIWQTATNWGIFWAGDNNAYRSHFSTSNPNEIVFIGNGNLRASIDLDNGNAFFGGEVYADNYNIIGPGGNISLNPAYGSGGADLVLFDFTPYAEAELTGPIQGNEILNVTQGEYVERADAPFAGKVIQTSAYRRFYSDYIPTVPGEDLYGEISVQRVSGSGGRLYYGIERFDKNKNPIAGNTGTTYFVVGGTNYTSTSWTTYRNHTTLPTSHTPYNGSDGGGVYYVRIRILMNYASGGALRRFGGIMLKRRNAESNLLADDIQALDRIDAGGIIQSAASVRAPIFYDSNDTNWYVDPASESRVNELRLNRLEDAGGSFLLRPGTTSGSPRHLNLWDSTGDPSQANGGTGITWGQRGDNNPYYLIWTSRYNNGYSTYARLRLGWHTGVEIGGNPAYGGTRFFADAPGISTTELMSVGRGDSHVRVTNNFYAPIFYDTNDTNFYANPNNTSRFNQAIFTNATPLRFQTTSTALFDHESNSTPVAFRMNKGGSSLSDGANFGVLQLSRTNHNNGATGAGAGLYFNLKDSSGTLREYAGILGRKTVASASGGELQFMSYGRSVMASMNATFFQHNSQIRAPIYYDSNNTAYYGDFASTSRFNRIDPNSINIRDRGGFITFYNNTSNQHAIGSRSNTGAETDDLRINTYGALYINLDSNNNNSSAADFRIGRHGGGTGSIQQLGLFDVYGDALYVYSAYSFRAPIFYDSNDTAYYLDPASTSRLNNLGVGLQASNGGKLSVTGGHGDSDIRLTAQGNQLGSGVTSSMHWWVSEPGITWNEGGFGYNVVNNGGTPNGFGRPNTSYGQAYMRFTTGGTQIFYNTNTSGTRFENMSTRPDGTVFVNNYLFAGNSLRAPIFYDTNNTGYYTNPASTSVMNTVRVAARYEHNTSSSRTKYNVYGTGASAYSIGMQSGIRFGHLNDWAMTFQFNNRSARGFWWGDDGHSTSAGAMSLTTNGRLTVARSLSVGQGEGITSPSATTLYVQGIGQATSDFRAPIFYDTNNTGYFANPAGRSRLASMDYGNGSYYLAGGDWGYRHNTPYGWIQFGPANTSHAHIYTDRSSFYFNVNEMYMNGRFVLNENRTINNKYFGSDGSIRAAIFYDINNTAYYFDGASRFSTRFEGVNNRTKARMGLSGQTRSSAMNYDDRVVRTSNQSYWIGSKGWGRVDMNTVANWGSGFIDSWSNPPNQPSGTSHWVGTQAYHYSNGSARYGWQMVGGPIGNLRFRNTWSGFSAWRTVPMLDVNNGNTGAMYAGIYYDANNTGFYMDPASTSYWSTSQQNGYHTFLNYGIGVTGRYSASRLQLVFAMGSAYRPNAAGTSTSNMYGIGWSHPNAGGLGGSNQLNDHGMLIINNGGFRAAISSRAVFASDVRTPIYYDWNDTGYYLDPNSTSNAALRIRGGTLHGPNPTWGRYLYVGTNGNVSSEACVATTNGNLHLDSRSGRDLYLQWYVNRTVFVRSAIQATLFYDRNNTGFYCDPSATTRLNNVIITGTLTGGGGGVSPNDPQFTGTALFGTTQLPQAGNPPGVSITGANVGYFNPQIRMTQPSNLGTYFLFYGSSGAIGAIHALFGSTQFATSSDYRMKENIVPVENAVDRIGQLNPIRFNFIGHEQAVDGFLAHEVQSIVPEAVAGEKDQVDENGNPVYQGIDQSKLVPLLIAAVQELTARLEALENV